MADDLAEDAAGRLAQIRRLEMQRRETRARGDGEQEPGAAPQHVFALGHLLAAEQENAGDEN